MGQPGPPSPSPRSRHPLPDNWTTALPKPAPPPRSSRRPLLEKGTATAANRGGRPVRPGISFRKASSNESRCGARSRVRDFVSAVPYGNAEILGRWAVNTSVKNEQLAAMRTRSRLQRVSRAAPASVGHRGRSLSTG